ncbi:MAG TPA: PIN domain-containing protein [Candidatus Nanoarchaeia archaeon]|nr:PIN domain-containing protein [Candidatus Nanoarchaeia archaeon]
MIIDNNILFSIMKPDSSASRIFELGALKFVAPEFVKSELNEHKDECQAKSGLSKKEFEQRRAEVEARITFVSVEAYKGFLKKAVRAVSDSDDAPYVAVALALKMPIWSNDADLKKQSLADVFSTRELIELLPD